MTGARAGRPTELELLVLKALWRSSPATVDEVRATLAAGGRELTHSTVITVMNLMVDKRLLSRAKRGRAFEYVPLAEERDVGRRLLGDLVDRVFAGSAKAVVLELLETADVDESELSEIRRLINRKARERRDGPDEAA